MHITRNTVESTATIINGVSVVCYRDLMTSLFGEKWFLEDRSRRSYDLKVWCKKHNACYTKSTNRYRYKQDAAEEAIAANKTIAVAEAILSLNL